MLYAESRKRQRRMFRKYVPDSFQGVFNSMSGPARNVAAFSRVLHLQIEGSKPSTRTVGQVLFSCFRSALSRNCITVTHTHGTRTQTARIVSCGTVRPGGFSLRVFVPTLHKNALVAAHQERTEPC